MTEPVPDLTALLEEASEAHQRGALEQAETRYRELLALAPQHAVATQLLGVLRNQVGDFEGAAVLLKAALRLNPRSAMAHLNLGLALWNLGRTEEALVHHQYALVFKPDNPEALLNRSLILQELERPEEALAGFDRFLALQPDHPLALLHRAIALKDLLRLEPAIAAFDRVLARHPATAEALANRGITLQRAGRHREALADLDRALDLEPERLDALVNRATALHHIQRNPEALESLAKALRLRPDFPEALVNQGLVFLDLNQPREALERFDRVLRLEHDLTEAILMRGKALQVLHRPEEAEAGFREALASAERAEASHPDQALAFPHRAHALLELHRPQEALQSLDQVLARNPVQVDAMLSRATTLSLLNRHAEAYEAYAQVLAIDPANNLALSGRVFALDYLPETTIQDHQAERRTFYQAQAATLPAPIRDHRNDRDPGRPLRIGYVSADFCFHSAALCFGPVLRRHDRSHFQVVGYSGVLIEDAWTEGFRQGAALWRSTCGVSDDDLAAMIQADGIDILVDLSGHSKGNRLLTFARKPAPIQVTAWGHGGGTGLPMVDYQFADPVLFPPAERGLFAETCLDLPCAITFEAPSDAPAVGPLPALANGFLTFGSLNRFLKNTPEMLDLWARILVAVPGSRLLLKDRALHDSVTRAQILAAFAAHGVGPDRLSLLGHTSQRDHLDTYNQVDVVLDPFPMNGGITTWEALWMGPPVLAALGEKPGSRLSAAILVALGLEDWVAPTAEAYLALAVAKAGDLEGLARHRRDSRARILGSAAGDPVRYTRAVEAAYRAMWLRWLAQ